MSILFFAIAIYVAFRLRVPLTQLISTFFQVANTGLDVLASQATEHLTKAEQAIAKAEAKVAKATTPQQLEKEKQALLAELAELQSE